MMIIRKGRSSYSSYSCLVLYSEDSKLQWLLGAVRASKALIRSSYIGAFDERPHDLASGSSLDGSSSFPFSTHTYWGMSET